MEQVCSIIVFPLHHVCIIINHVYQIKYHCCTDVPIYQQRFPINYIAEEIAVQNTSRCHYYKTVFLVMGTFLDRGSLIKSHLCSCW